MSLHQTANQGRKVKNVLINPGNPTLIRHKFSSDRSIQKINNQLSTKKLHNNKTQGVSASQNNRTLLQRADLINNLDVCQCLANKQSATTGCYLVARTLRRILRHTCLSLRTLVDLSKMSNRAIMPFIFSRRTFLLL